MRQLDWTYAVSMHWNGTHADCAFTAMHPLQGLQTWKQWRYPVRGLVLREEQLLSELWVATSWGMETYTDRH